MKRVQKALSACVLAGFLAPEVKAHNAAVGRTLWRLFCAGVFLGVVHLVYLKLSNRTLDAMMTSAPLARSEQFTLSVLIHYPDYVILALLAGVFALFCLHLLVLKTSPKRPAC